MSTRKKWLIVGLVFSLMVCGKANVGFAKEKVKKPAKEKGLVAYWSFDEGEGARSLQGDKVKDLSGQGNDGTIKGGVEWVKGIKRNALKFNGKNGYVQLPSSAGWGRDDTITILLWLNVPKEGGGHFYNLAYSITIAEKHNFFEFMPHIDRNDGCAHFWAYAINNGKRDDLSIVDRSHDYRDGKWHQFAFVYSGGPNPVPTLYIDGKYIGKDYRMPLTNFDWDAEQSLGNTLGRARGYWYCSGPFKYFKGLMDEVKIYNRALTEEEIEKHYFLLMEEEWVKERASSLSGKMEAIDYSDNVIYHSKEKQETPNFTERFQNAAIERLTTLGGSWKVSHEVEIYDVEERDIYHSPEEPSHLRWCRVRKGKDGVLKVGISQLSGNLGLEPSYRPCHFRSDKEWLEFHKKNPRGKIGPKDAIPTTKAAGIGLLSFDNGKTWVSEANHLFIPDESRRGGTGQENLYCRDGRILSTANSRMGEWSHNGKALHSQRLLGIRESMDKGKTYTPLQWILPEGTDPVFVKEGTEEVSMVELGDGRILVMIRCNPGSPCQMYLTRVGPGKYEGTPPTLLSIPHSGNPEMIRCANGVIWYWGTDGHWYTEDEGKTWRRPIAKRRLLQYYGRIIDVDDDTIVCLTQHDIRDSPYPYWHDSSLRMYRFKWHRSGILKQVKANVRFARAIRREETFGDMHARADVRLDGVNGIIFHVSPDGKSYYGFLVIMDGHSLYKSYYPPEVQQEVFAANYTKEDTYSSGLGWPMAVLVKVDKGKLTILRGIRVFDDPRKLTWAKMQVKVCGDIIQGAIKIKGPAIYVSARDNAFSSGSVGFFTDRSIGAFRNLEVWDKPLMIRHLWK